DPIKSLELFAKISLQGVAVADIVAANIFEPFKFIDQFLLYFEFFCHFLTESAAVTPPFSKRKDCQKTNHHGRSCRGTDVAIPPETPPAAAWASLLAPAAHLGSPRRCRARAA